MRHLITLLSLGLSCAASAQRYYFENVTVVDGLQASKVYAILQDSTGLIWIGTEAGLASYDGTSVFNYDVNSGVAPGGVRSLFLDRDRHLWCGHLGGGVSISEGRKFKALEFEGGPLTSDITAIQQDADGSIWLGTFGQGALRIATAPTDGPVTVERFTDPTGAGERITGIVKLKNDGLVFLDVGNGLRQWSADKKRFEPFHVSALAELPKVNSFFEDGGGALWAGTDENGAVRYDPKTGKSTIFDINTGLPDNTVNCFGEDGTGHVWISVWGKGLVEVANTGSRLFSTSTGLHSDKVRAMMRDREGNLLIATHDEGLDIYKGDGFRSFSDIDGLIERHVWAVVEDHDHRIWFGTSEGITILDPTASGPMSIRDLTYANGDIPYYDVRALTVDAAGHVWIGTGSSGDATAGGLGEWAAGRKIDHADLSPLLGKNQVTALAPAPQGGVYVGTFGSLLYLVPGNVPKVIDMQDGLAGSDVTALFNDSKGNTWVGTASSGASMIRAGSPTKAQRIDIGQVITPTSFTEDVAGRIWVGTQSRGVFVLENGKVVANYDERSGLLSSSVRSLITDANGHVWIGTNKGLNQRKKDSDVFLAFTERSGFTGIEANPGAVCRTHDGDFWFGTTNGANLVVVDHGQEHVEAPLIAVRVLKVNLVERDAIDGVDLSHSESDVHIEYGCVSLSDQGAVRYQYMLEGLQKEWQPVTAETDAHYPTLPPGGYVFKVRARNRSGLWSDPPVLYHFTVLPPWYRSWWFYSALVLVSAIVLFSYIKVRERQLKARNQELERKVEERTAEVVAQSKEIEGQKGRIEGLLLNILPKSISDELNEKGKATARMHPEVTVMFTDMKGFTRVAEKMTPEELVRELDECFIQIDRIIGRYGIEKIKTIGDSYMCASGIPQSDPWHAHKMLLAALEVREMMARWCRQREALGKEPWVLRIGIHTGPVVAGVVGQRKFAYDIWGDTVNTASRMESSGATGEVNISGATFALIKDDFQCEHRGKVEAKNKGLIDMYFVRRLDPELSADANGVWASASYLRSLGLTQLIEELA